VTLAEAERSHILGQSVIASNVRGSSLRMFNVTRAAGKIEVVA
jgi:hypothetical protein